MTWQRYNKNLRKSLLLWNIFRFGQIWPYSVLCNRLPPGSSQHAERLSVQRDYTGRILRVLLWRWLHGRPQPISEGRAYGASANPCPKRGHSAAWHRGNGNGEHIIHGRKDRINSLMIIWDYSHPQYNASLDKLNSILHRNRVNNLPKCSFLNYFFVPLPSKFHINTYLLWQQWHYHRHPK